MSYNEETTLQNIRNNQFHLFDNEIIKVSKATVPQSQVKEERFFSYRMPMPTRWQKVRSNNNQRSTTLYAPTKSYRYCWLCNLLLVKQTSCRKLQFLNRRVCSSLFFEQCIALRINVSHRHLLDFRKYIFLCNCNSLQEMRKPLCTQKKASLGQS